MLNRKTAYTAQARQVTSPVQAIAVLPVSSTKPTLASSRAVLTPFTSVTSNISRRVVVVRAVAEAAVAPSDTKQEKTTNPLNLVFVATEVSRE